jgi:hypothetical protein
MKWQLSGPWPVGAICLEAGTIITDDIGLPMPPPINAMALDEESALAMAMAYNERDTINGWHHLHFAPGIDRDKIFAQARHKKRWPNGEPVPQTMSGPEPPPSIAVKEEKPRGSRKSRR